MHFFLTNKHLIIQGCFSLGFSSFFAFVLSFDVLILLCVDVFSVSLDNISPQDRIIWLKPGETILGHTNEFLGGRKTVTTMMKARSSMGRNFIEVCKVRMNE